MLRPFFISLSWNCFHTTPFFGTVTVADGIANGTVSADKTLALTGDTVTLTVTPKTGYVVESVTAGSVQVTKVDDTHYTFTMPASDVTVSATFTPDSARFSQDGDTYTIHDAAGWDVFCDCLQDNDTYNRFSGKTVELGDNITVSRMAGSSHHDFCGTFEGNGKTLTFSPTESVNGTAPFSYVSETTPTGGTAVSHPVIRNLNVVCDINTSETHASGLVGRMWGELTIANCTVSGTITSSNKYACGFIGEQNGTANITNCRSSVEINSSVTGDGTHSGFIGRTMNNTSTCIEGCVFDGKIVSTGTGDNATTSCGGFVGWRDKNGSLTITDSLYAPTADDNAVTDGATFARNWTMPDNANCYYTRTLGTAQGKQAYTITPGADVTLGLSGTATEYNVSGINVYSSGIEYNGNLYAGSGDTVALELEYTGTPEAGYIQNGYTASAGTLSGTTLTMPEDNVTINADFDVESYFDEETVTLTLKGTVLNGDNGIVLPDGVNKNDVLHIIVDSSGATLPQDSSYLFSSFDNVTSIDLTGADTSGVENMYGMFFQCLNLRKLVLSGFDTSSVDEMSYMFYYCKKLATLDLSGFDTRIVYDMVSMFESCTGLTTIYVSNEWSTVSANYHNLMFTWCYNLTGGNGTAFDPDYIDKTYAVIDKDGQPGYLTGLFALKLPDNMEIVTDADENMKVGSKYLSGAALTVKPKTGYTASNVKANGTDLTADDNGVYTVTITDSNVTVTADFAFSDGIGAALAGHSISLEGDIGVNYYTELSDAIAKSETAKMHFTIPSGTGTKTQDVSVKDASVDTVGGKTYYIFKCQVAAKEMTSQITAQLIDGEYKSDVFPYSVKEYADYLLAHTGDNADYAKAAPLVKAMLNYGAYAQLYFDKNTGTLANAGLTAGEKEPGDVAITIADPVIENLPKGTTFEGATLSLKSETTLSLYFKSSDDLIFSCDGYDVVPDSKGGYKIARIRGIKAADIGKTLTLNVSGGTVSYSPLNYCKYVLADDTQNEKLQNAVKALVLYWQAAAAYFGAPAAGISFTKVTDESEITVGNIGVCTFEEAKAWAIANWDNITDTGKADVYIVFSDDNRICYIRIEIWVTAKQDIEEMSEPDIGMDINVIKNYYTNFEEDNEVDFYLCGRSFKKVTDESRITLKNIGECTFEEAKAWVIANWDDIMGTDSTPVNIVFFNGNDICLIQISGMTEITDFMEIDEPVNGMRIDFIQDLFTEFCGDVYLCSPAALP